MIIEGEYQFHGPRPTVWELLQDPEVLVKVMPGTKALERESEDLYRGRMVVGVGPVNAAEFAVTIELRDKEPFERYGMQVEGNGALGYTRGTSSVELLEDGEGGTIMRYRADLQVGGRIAGVGQRLLETVARMMTQQGLAALDREVTRRLEEGE